MEQSWWISVISTNVTTIITGHGNIRPYLHRLKIIRNPECPCKHDTRTVDHTIFQCKRLKSERKILKSSALKVGNWPVSKSETANRNLKQLIGYIKLNGTCKDKSF